MAQRPGAANEPDCYICEHIHEALARDPRTHELDVQVSLVAGRLFLTGTVATPQRQAAILEVVRELAPDYEVQSAISVGAHPETAEAEELS